MNRLSKKVALITGAASGLGREMALLFAQEGASVAVSDIADSDGEAVAEEIRANGGSAIFLNLDVSSEQDWIAAMAEIESVFGKLNILVNNAGIAPPGTTEMEFTQWRNVMTCDIISS